LFAFTVSPDLPHEDSSAACAIVKLAEIPLSTMDATAPGTIAAMKSFGDIIPPGQ
jgi:hypothetical protein